jgi:hypothetical protein
MLVVQPQSDTQPSSRRREDHQSRDGQWRSFPKLHHLRQYVSNGDYYARIELKGKVIRQSLKTMVWTTAKLRPADFLKEHQEGRSRVDPLQYTDDPLYNHR